MPLRCICASSQRLGAHPEQELLDIDAALLSPLLDDAHEGGARRGVIVLEYLAVLLAFSVLGVLALLDPSVPAL